MHRCGGQRTNFRSQFSSSTVWVSGLELRSVSLSSNHPLPTEPPLAPVYLVKKACILWPVNYSSIKLVLNMGENNVAGCYLEASLMKGKNNKQ